MKNPSPSHDESQQKRNRTLGLLAITGFFVFLLALGGDNLTSVEAAPALQATVTPAPENPAGAVSPEQGSMHSSDCMTCHALPDFTGRLGNGDTVNLTVDAALAQTNLHSRLGKCNVCHIEFNGYPHANTKTINCSKCHFTGDTRQGIEVSLPFEDGRELTAAMNDRCYTCHENVYVAFTSGNHAKIQNAGNLNAPFCSDCHTSHSVQRIANIDPYQSCSNCHAATYNSFQSSVHGSALAKVSTADAPNCGSCHDHHSLDGPNNPVFIKNSVGACLKCHQDEVMMARYDLPADLFDTSVDNYHSLGVEVVGREDLNVAGNILPVCVDCHGSHSIQAGASAGSAVNSANVLGTCLKCHVGEANFVVAGKAHIRSSSLAVQGVRWIEGFFGYFVPFTIGLVALYIALDARKLWSERNTGPASHE